jgi:hypothetical protein
VTRGIGGFALPGVEASGSRAGHLGCRAARHPASEVGRGRDLRFRYTVLVRRLPNVGSLVEWLAAGVVAAATLSACFTWVGPWLTNTPGGAPSVEANQVPEGVPPRAQSVPMLVLLDGTTIRVGDLQSDLRARLGESPDDPAPEVSRGPFGDRIIRTYDRQGSQFFVVCERTEPAGPVKVARIYLPR